MYINQIREKFQMGLWAEALQDRGYVAYARRLGEPTIDKNMNKLKQLDTKAIAYRLKTYFDESAPKSIQNDEDFSRLCMLLEIDIGEYDELAMMSARQFFDVLDAERQAKVLRRAARSGQTNWVSGVLGNDLAPPPDLSGARVRAIRSTETSTGDTLHVMRTNLHDYRDRTLIKTTGASEVDQKFMYLDPQAVDCWRTLTHDTNRYPTFKYCSEALATMLNASPSWNDLIAQGGIGRVVVLGAGASEKDIAILDSFSDASAYHNRSDRLRYVIVDSSPYMLGEAAATISSVPGGFTDIARIESVWADFMYLDRLQEEFGQKQFAVPAKTKSAYFCLGGTISNINEEAFFTSVNAVARQGDLLVIGVEFFELDSSSEYKKDLGKL